MEVTNLHRLPNGNKTFKMTIVTIKGHLRCVYLNDFRLVGSKPHVSEGGKYKDLAFTLDDLRRAFPELEIAEKVI